MDTLIIKKSEKLLNQGKPQEAIQFLNKLLAASHAKLGDIYFEIYKYDMKKSYRKFIFDNYSKATTLDSLNSDYLVTLGWLYYWFGFYDKSEKLCKKVLELDDTNLGALRTLGITYQWGKKDLRNAEILFRRIIKIYPDKTTGYIRLAILLERKRQFKKALRMYLKALDVDRHDLYTYYLLFNLFDYRNCADIKKEIAKMALASKPDSKLATRDYWYKGKFYSYLNNNKKAREIYKSFLRKHKRKDDDRKTIEWELNQIIWNENQLRWHKKHKIDIAIPKAKTHAISKKQKIELVKIWNRWKNRTPKFIKT